MVARAEEKTGGDGDRITNDLQRDKTERRHQTIRALIPS